jgi:hypothetical protein
VTGMRMSSLHTKDLLMFMVLAHAESMYRAATDWARLVHNTGPVDLQQQQLYSCICDVDSQRRLQPRERALAGPRYGRSRHRLGYRTFQRESQCHSVFQLSPSCRSAWRRATFAGARNPVVSVAKKYAKLSADVIWQAKIMQEGT